VNFNVDHDKSSSNVRSARLKHEHICVTSSLQTLDAFIYIETEKNPGKEERKKEKKKKRAKAPNQTHVRLSRDTLDQFQTATGNQSLCIHRAITT